MKKIQDIFKLDLSTRGGVRLFDRIANRYNLIKSERKELRNELINNTSKTSNFQYDSNHIVWKIAWNNVEHNQIKNILMFLVNIPLYATYSQYMDGGGEYLDKYYGIISHFLIGTSIQKIENNNISNDSSTIMYIEECKGPYTVSFNTGEIIEVNNLEELMIIMSGNQYDETNIEEFMATFGLIKIPYEDFNLRINEEIGNFLN